MRRGGQCLRRRADPVDGPQRGAAEQVGGHRGDDEHDRQDGHQFPDQIGGDVVGEPAQRAIGVGFVSGVAELDDGDGTGCCQNERHGGAEDEGESPSDGPLSGGAHAVLRPCAAGIRHREWFPAR